MKIKAGDKLIAVEDADLVTYVVTDPGYGPNNVVLAEAKDMKPVLTLTQEQAKELRLNWLDPVGRELCGDCC